MNFCYAPTYTHLAKCSHIVSLCGPESGCLVGGGTHNVVSILMLYKLKAHDTRVMSSPASD